MESHGRSVLDTWFKRGPILVIFMVVAGCAPASHLAPGVPVTQVSKALPTTTPTEAAQFAPTLTATPSPTITAMPTPAEIWYQLVLRTPVPWTTPLPPAERSPLDDTYGKFDPSEIEWWICRRCPDYLPAGGNWRLQLDKGVYRIYYEVIQWRSLGSFVVVGDRIYLFNDPYCQWDVGEYRWKLENRELTFKVVKDACAIGMRAANLTGYPWMSCQPPNKEAAISDHWIKPLGCER